MKGLRIEQKITQRADASLQRYLREIARLSMVEVEEEVMLARKVREGDQAALDKLVRSNLRFVVSCAKRYQNMGLPLADLINEGNIGLIKAAQLFDETKGFKFISYAVWWIRQSMMNALNLEVRMIKLPINIVRLTSQIRAVSDRMEKELERLPTAEEICTELDLPFDTVAIQFAFGRTMMSLDATLKDDSDMQLWSVLEDKNSPQADQGVMGDSLATDVERMLGVLRGREQRILIDFFGFRGQVARGLEDIAQDMGISCERVRQLKKLALQRIREKMEEKDFSLA